MCPVRSQLSAQRAIRSIRAHSRSKDAAPVRGRCAFDRSRRMSFAWTPRSQVVNVKLNGVYQAVYELVEHVRIARSLLLQLHDDRDGFLRERSGDAQRNRVGKTARLHFATWRKRTARFSVPQHVGVAQPRGVPCPLIPVPHSASLTLSEWRTPGSGMGDAEPCSLERSDPESRRPHRRR